VLAIQFSCKFINFADMSETFNDQTVYLIAGLPFWLLDFDIIKYKLCEHGKQYGKSSLASIFKMTVNNVIDSALFLKIWSYFHLHRLSSSIFFSSQDFQKFSFLISFYLNISMPILNLIHWSELLWFFFDVSLTFSKIFNFGVFWTLRRIKI
jgi:hypothetical protein